MRIVEFGPGSLPIFDVSRTVNAQLQAGAEYIGIDADTNHTYLGKKRQTQFIVGELFKIPLRAGIADQVWVDNVFSGPIIRRPERTEKGLTYVIGGIVEHIQLMGNLLKPMGKMFIGEWYARYSNPEWLKIVDYKNIGLTNHLYEGTSFHDFVQQYKIFIYHIDRDVSPFFLELTKK